MPLEFRTTGPDDLPRIKALLQSAFQMGPETPNFDDALLRWKYWEPGTTWQGSRGYVLEKDGAMVAHGALWPLRIEGAVAANLLDWAAVKFPPGMGVSLVRRLSEIAPVLVSTGGSKATRAIMPRIGFRHIGNQSIYVRVLRPLRQYRTRPPEPALRALPRLARNISWSIAPPVPLCGLTASPAASLDDPAADHLLKCPSAAVTAWSLGELGYFLLSRVGGQSRIARLRHPDPTAAYAVAVRTALLDPEACELVALSSSLTVDQALEVNHFRRREQRPVFVHDPGQLIPKAAYPLEFDMLDDDLAYLNIPEYPYFA